MNLPSEIDVLIVGAGPVGAALANLCGRLGLHALMIDKLPEIQTHPRAIALDNEALRVLQISGLSDTDFERTVIPEVRLHSPIFGEFARMNTRHRFDEHPMLVTFFQPELEHALHRALSRYETIQVARPVEWQGTVEDAKGCTVTLGLPDGRVHTLRTTFVVAADGASSPIRHALNIGFEGSSYQEDWLIVDALNVPTPIDHIEFHCNPRRPAPHMPAPGGRQRWEFMLHPGESRIEMLREEKVKELLAPWVDADTVTIERTAVYRFHARTVRQFRSGRTLLVGDAAHVTPPFIGQGLVAGLRDVANLAWKLAWVVQENASPRILGSYHTERQPHARAMIRLAQWMGKLIMPRSQMTAIVAHGIARLMTLIPGLRGLIVDVKIKPKNRFTDGLFAPRRHGSRFEHGNHLVQGRLRESDGKVVRSDEALGQRLQLLGINTDPLASLTTEQRELWSALGGSALSLHSPDAASPTPASFADIDNAFGSASMRQGWIVVVRPDKVVMADGAPADAGRLVDTVAALLR